MKDPMDKPFKGRLTEWSRKCWRDVPWANFANYPDDLYFITCRFVDHEDFAGNRGYTSNVIKEYPEEELLDIPFIDGNEVNIEPGEILIETENSIYILCKQELPATEVVD